MVALFDDDERFLAELAEAAAAGDQAAADEALAKYEAIGRWSSSLLPNFCPRELI